MNSSGCSTALPELATVPAGPRLAALLEGVDRISLSGVELAEVVKAQRRLASHYHAESLASGLELGLRDVPLGNPADSDELPVAGARLAEPSEFSSEVLRCVLHMTRAGADIEFWTTWHLQQRLPAVWEAFLAGVLDFRRAKTFTDVLQELTRLQIDVIVDRMLPKAAKLTSWELQRRLQAEAMAIDPDWWERRYKQAIKTRRVVKTVNPDGTANLAGYDLPFDEATQAMANITRLAKAAKNAGDHRKIDAIRADIFNGYLTGAYQHATDNQIIADLLNRATANEDTDPPQTGTQSEPSRQGPFQTEPPGRMPSQAETSRMPSQAESPASQAKPSGRKPSQVEPQRREPSQSRSPERGRSQTGPSGPGPSKGGPSGRGPSQDELGLEELDFSGEAELDRVTEDDLQPHERPEPSDDPPDDPNRAPWGDLPKPRKPIHPGGAPTAGPASSHHAARAGSAPAPHQRVRAGYELRVELSTLLGLDGRPAQVPGSGPVPAFLARTMVAEQARGHWRFAITDDHGLLIDEGVIRDRPVGMTAFAAPVAGAIVEIAVPESLLQELHANPAMTGAWVRVVGNIARRHANAAHAPRRRQSGAEDGRRAPLTGLRRHVEIRDRFCLAPGCTRPASQSDLDHQIEYAVGGDTTAANLRALCRHHHRLRHDGGWRMTGAPGGGYRWISPRGLTFETRPPPIIADLPPPVPR